MSIKTDFSVRQRGSEKNAPDIDEEYSFEDLKGAKFPRLNWVVDGIIVEGLTLLAARPKLGKSWMVLDIALAAASGGNALTNIPCEKMTALYYALEDNPRRLKRRGRKLVRNGAWPRRLFIRHRLERLDKGGLDDIRDWVEERDASLVIIDTYNHIRPPRKGNEEAYASDYMWLGQLQKLATELRISIVVVHHVRKAEASDPMDLITGSAGLQAAVDTLIVLTRDSTGVVLHVRGRDIGEEIEKCISFDRDTCLWEILGSVEDVGMSLERREIIGVLKSAEEPMGPTEIAQRVQKSAGAVTKMLFDMAKSGQVRKSTRGRYTC